MTVDKDLLILKPILLCRLACHNGTLQMRPQVKPNLGIHK
jgi:hypothetical protein